MRNGVCVKCGEATVHKSDGVEDEEGIDHYFCGTCGYIEQYFVPQVLSKAVEQCPRVVPTGTD